jgi:hypothetical protein
VCAAALVPAALAASADAAESAERTIVLTDAAEAWYAVTPTSACTAPVGCLPAAAPPVTTYPTDTLHVGRTAEQETARTYLRPDLSALPSDADLVRGEMTLSVDPDPQSGTSSPETATIKACLVTAAFADGTEGSTGPLPAIDCRTWEPATYDAKTSTLTFGLLTFFAKWRGGAPPHGIALVGAPGAEPAAAWHVALDGKNRAQRPHATAKVTYVAADAETVTAPAPPVQPSARAFVPTTPTLPLAPVPGVVLPPVVDAAPDAVTAPPPPVTRTTHRAFTGAGAAASPAVIAVVPVLVAAGFMFFLRALSREVRPARPGTGGLS